MALRDIAAGESVDTGGRASLTALQDVPYSHKVALSPIAAGEEIIKYGEPIGRASRDISAGEWVHTHNIDAAAPGPREA